MNIPEGAPSDCSHKAGSIIAFPGNGAFSRILGILRTDDALGLFGSCVKVGQVSFRRISFSDYILDDEYHESTECTRGLTPHKLCQMDGLVYEWDHFYKTPFPIPKQVGSKIVFFTCQAAVHKGNSLSVALVRLGPDQKAKSYDPPSVPRGRGEGG